MNVTNPTHAAARRTRWMQPLRTLLWSVSGAILFTIPFVLVGSPGHEPYWALWFFPAAVICVLLVGWIDVNTDIPARHAAYPWPYVLWIFGIWAGCGGAGLLLGRAWLSIRSSSAGVEYDPAPQLIGLGAALLLVAPAVLVSSALLRSRNAKNADRSRSIQLAGPRVSAVVTEVTRWKGTNVPSYYRVTLKFQDSQGTERWHRAVHHRKHLVGSRHWIRYDPDRPGRRSTIFVEWAR